MSVTNRSAGARRVWLAAAPVLFITSSALADFTVVALPDTQYYTVVQWKTDQYYTRQTQWVVSNRTAQNIAFVTHLGDLEQDGDWSNWPTNTIENTAEWDRASGAQGYLDNNNIPNAVAPGNHDYAHWDSKTNPYMYQRYFGSQRYSGKTWYGGSGYSSMDAWHKFTADGYNFINISLQYAPDQADLSWAQGVINANPGKPVMITTHSFLTTSGIEPGRENVWNQFLQHNPQVFMILNGHVNGVRYQTQTGTSGNPVYEMLSDYQDYAFSGYANGGGYLRLLKFVPSANQIQVKTYSPTIGNYMTDGANQFTISNFNLNTRYGPSSSTPQSSKTLSFQNGINGYLGQHDTYIISGYPNDSYGGSNPGVVNKTSGSGEFQSMIKYDSLFGTGASQVPVNAQITSAKLTIYTSTDAYSNSNDHFYLYRLLTGWSEGSTWNSLTNGLAADGTEAVLAAEWDVVPSTLGGAVTFDVTPSVWAWAHGAPNYGWVIFGTGSDDWKYLTTEYSADYTKRPKLSITWSYASGAAPGIVPEPALGLFGLAAVAALRRRRS